MKAFVASALVAIAAATPPTEAGTSSVTVSREAFLMGTRASLSVVTPTRQAGVDLLEQALRTLEAADGELSTWKPDSEISRINRQPLGSPWLLSNAGCLVFEALDRWHRATSGLFDPAIGQLTDAWSIHGEGRIPSADALARAREQSGWRHVAFDRRQCVITRTSDVRLDVGGFGKGEALDRAATIFASDTPWLIDLGGQVSVGGVGPGSPPFEVAIAHPLDRQREALSVRLTSGSLSTSAGSERDLAVDGQRVGHILDPRTGTPATFRGSVTVWHPRGLVADVLSTALFVMGPDDGLDWAERHGLSVCYLIPGHSGRLRMATTSSFRMLSAQG